MNTMTIPVIYTVDDVRFTSVNGQIIEIYRRFTSEKYKFQYTTGAYGNSGPFGLLSGPMYRIKLLSVLFLVTPIYTSTHAKRIVHVPLRLNNRPLARPFGATSWGPVQGKVAVIAVLIISTPVGTISNKFYPCASSAE